MATWLEWRVRESLRERERERGRERERERERERDGSRAGRVRAVSWRAGLARRLALAESWIRLYQCAGACARGCACWPTVGCDTAGGCGGHVQYFSTPSRFWFDGVTSIPWSYIDFYYYMVIWILIDT